MNWERVRIENLMWAAAGEDRLAAASGRPPARDALYGQDARSESARTTKRRVTEPVTRRAARTEPQIAALREQVTRMRSQGNRKKTEALARRGLTLLTNAGSSNLRADRQFFREALDWAAETPLPPRPPKGPSAPAEPARSKRSTRKSTRRRTPPKEQRQSPHRAGARPRPSATTEQTRPAGGRGTPGAGSGRGRGDRRQQRFRLRLRFLGELQRVVGNAGGSVVVSAGGAVEVKGPTGSVKFSTGSLNAGMRVRHQTKIRIERFTGLDLNALDWPMPPS